MTEKPHTTVEPVGPAGSPSDSVYSIREPAPRSGGLAHLRPLNDEAGWHAARSLLKPLNHLPYLARKEEIAKTLGLHNVETPAEDFRRHYALLERHQAREVATDEVIDHLVRWASRQSPEVDRKQAMSLLGEYATVRHMEFHPSDVCNLTCVGCTYGHDDPLRKPAPTQFPFGALSALTVLQPKSMVIIGGGEPTLYRDGAHTFDDLMTEVHGLLPGLHSALTTNGTHKPPGNWPDSLKWVRLSLDAATTTTYSAFRGRDMFERVEQNFIRYLEHDIPQVGISFLFGRTNVHEYVDVARLVFDRVMALDPSLLHRVNVQYRPLRADPYRYEDGNPEAVTSEQIEAVVVDLEHQSRSDDRFAAFLREQTNCTAILGGNTHPAYDFARCYYTETFTIVRASGELRPCFIRVNEPDFVLGNVITDAPATIALNRLYIAARQKPFCDPHGCRQCHVNHTFEQGIRGALAPSTSPAVLADPMY